MIRARARAGGFTLVEVMVALAVVAVALPALMLSLSQQVDGTAYLRDKSLANMVAANKLAEMRVLARARQDLLSGSATGVENMAGRDWYWWIESKPTDIANFRRLEIRVALGEEEKETPLHTLVAFLSADLKAELPSVSP